MRIEILVDNEEPQIFPLNKPKIYIGSDPACDVTLAVDGISRKHLLIVKDDENFFLIDQGSTNGTYLNEERIVPGRRVEFTSFFPARLGGKVLITLLSDAEADDLGFAMAEMPDKVPVKKVEEFNEATRSISLKDLYSAKTETLVKQRQQNVPKRKIQQRVPRKPQSDKRKMLSVKLLCLTMMGSAIYWQYFMSEPVVNEIALKKTAIPQIVKVEKVIPKFAIVEENSLTPKQTFTEFTQAITCTTDVEKFLCDEFTRLNLKNWGALQVGTMINAMLDGQIYYDKARDLLPPLKTPENRLPTGEEIAKYQAELKLTAIIIFINEALPKDFNFEALKDVNVTFALKIIPQDPKRPLVVATTTPGPGETIPSTFPEELIVVAFVPASLAILKQKLDPSHFIYTKKYGVESLFFVKEFFRIY